MKQLIMSDELFPKPVGITNGHLTLRECSSEEADNVIIQHHYSHKATKNRFLSFSVNGGKGYMQLGYGIRPHIKHTVSEMITKDNYAEFDRMWLSDELPKFSETQTIALLLSYLKQVHPRIVFLITYADESAGNKGTIYKASNAFYLGSVAVDFYILPSGERVHPVSMYHRHKTRAWATLQNLYPGIRWIKHEGYKQHRFLYVLNPRTRRVFERRVRGERVEL